MLYGLLDYDGYICKSYYASTSRGEGDIEQIEKVLDDLTTNAISKIAQLDNDFDIKLVISGHTYKKDIYPSYKSKRTKNEYLGVFRDYIKETRKNELTCVPQLEADDVLVMMYKELSQKKDTGVIVFSDDKDLRYYCPDYCKINITEQIDYQQDYYNKQLEQMLIGDKEDDIQGINKVGEKTAEKLLSNNGYSLESVIKIYKDYNVNIDETLKNLLLVTPICPEYVDNYKYGFTDSDTMNNILGHFRYLNKKVTEVYNTYEPCKN